MKKERYEDRKKDKGKMKDRVEGRKYTVKKI
jgi:hypothetical protein